jgi:hypothetical protein
VASGVFVHAPKSEGEDRGQDVRVEIIVVLADESDEQLNGRVLWET